jgi:predicted RNA-binding protein with PIN domain
LREARAKHREGLADLKAENASLRRKLGEARASLREATASADESGRAAERARRDAEAAASAQDKELRQLRAQVERLEAEAQAGRRTARADREEATLRARLLLDTVIDAASGLRRELALPAVPGTPGDRVEAALEREGAAAGGGSSALSPAMLEQHLALPRARLIVDGYNVSKTAWPASSLEAQRIRLLNGLAPLVARTGAETTVIFDAAATTTRPVVAAPRGVKVRFSPEGVIADDVIRDLVAAEPEGRVVLVGTSDQALARDVARAGARVVPASVLAASIGAS